MSTSEVWEAVKKGHHVAVIGAALEPVPSSEVFVIQVDCEAAQMEPLGPLKAAQVEVEHAAGMGLGKTAAALEAKQMLAGLRNRIFAEHLAHLPANDLVNALNQLRKSSKVPTALVLRAVDRSDEETLQELHDALTEPDWVRVPLVLMFTDRPRQGPGSEIIEFLEDSSSGHVFGQAAAPAAAPTTRDELIPEGLSHDTLRVLRAAAVIGEIFEAELVASLLGIDLIDVLELLQEAADAGAALADAGDTRFRMAPELRKELESALLPSLARAWHAKLARLLAPVEKAMPSARAGDKTSPWPGPVPVNPQDIGVDAVGPGIAPEGHDRPLNDDWAALLEELPQTPEENPDLQAFMTSDRGTVDIGRPPSEVLAAAAPLPEPEASLGDIPELPDEGQPKTEASHDKQTARRTAPGIGVRNVWDEGSSGGFANQVRERQILSDARAGDHALAAGQIDQATHNYLNAAHEAVLAGAYQYALKFAHLSLQILDSQPQTASRRIQRIQVLAALGRIQWLAAGPSAHFTLEGALDALEHARAQLRPSDPIELGAEVSILIASVCYDMGDPAALERALDELGRTSHALLASGRPVEAARLLNDQAAVWVRIGDVVRANHLLEESRAVFEVNAEHNIGARLELAKTDHLIAKLTLHVAPRPGREKDAFEIGVSHAKQAAEAFHQMHLPREYARVLETLGRLHLRAGEFNLAGQLLMTAVKEQRRLGDLIGLARSTAALADVLISQGDPGRALALLQQSIRLNLGKGSPLGLESNREAINALAEVLENDEELGPRLARLETELARAERLLVRSG